MRLLRAVRGTAPAGRTREGVPTPGADGREEITGTAERARPTILCLPLIGWDLRRQRPQHLLEELASRGWNVLYTDLELEPGGREAVPGPPLAPGVRSLRLPSHRLSDPREGLPGREDLRLMVAALGRFQERARFHEVVVLCHAPEWAPLALALKQALGWKVVYDRMDLHTGFSTATDATGELELRLMRGADLVVATSERLEREAREFGAPTVRVPNGCQWELWNTAEPSEELAGLPRPVIGYFGAISDWFDVKLLLEIAIARPTWSFVLVGSTWGADTSRLEQLPNVHLLGERPYEQLPGLAAAFDVGIIPFKKTPLTEATDPVKLYEMLALGLDVVATPLPEIRSHAREGLVTTADGPEAFLEAIEAHLEHPASDDLVQRRKAVARESTWTRRADNLESALEELWPRVSVGIVTYNQKHLTELCLASVLRATEYPNIEIIVVDNGSTDGTREWLQEREAELPLLRVVLNDTNEGFAAGCNRAFAEARGEILCFLNNDTVVTRGWLSAMVRELESSPRIGMVGPSTNGVANAARVEPGYTGLHDLEAWAADFVWTHRDESFAIPMLALYCAAVPRRVWEEVGPLDEGYATGMFEDDDFSRRLRKAGYELRCVRGSWVHHWQQASFGSLPPEDYLRIYEENRRRYLTGGSVPEHRSTGSGAPDRAGESPDSPGPPAAAPGSGSTADGLVYDSARDDGTMGAMVREVIRYRDLLRLLVGTNIKTRYKRSLLGVVWTLLNPLLTMIVMTIAFSALFRFSLPNYPVYVLSGLVLWGFFQQSTTQAMESVVWGSALLKKVYIPAAVFPIAAIGTGLVNLGLSLAPILLIMLVLKASFTWALLFVPVGVGLLALFCLGLGLMVASIAVFFSDVVEMYGVLLRIWFYLTPVMYPKEILPERFAWIIDINPMYHFMLCWRDPIYRGVLPPTHSILLAAAWSAATLVAGWWIFARQSHQIALRA